MKVTIACKTGSIAHPSPKANDQLTGYNLLHRHGIDDGEKWGNGFCDQHQSTVAGGENPLKFD